MVGIKVKRSQLRADEWKDIQVVNSRLIRVKKEGNGLSEQRGKGQDDLGGRGDHSGGKEGMNKDTSSERREAKNDQGFDS